MSRQTTQLLGRTAPKRAFRHAGILILMLILVPPSVVRAQDTSPPADDPTPREVIASILDHAQGLEDVGVVDTDGVLVITGTADDAAALDRVTARLEASLDPDAYENDIRLSMDINDRVQGAADRVGAKAERLLGYLPLVPVALGVLLIAAFLAWLIGKMEWALDRLIRNPFLRGIVLRAIQVGVLLAGVLVALEILDAVALIGGVLGAAGVVGLAIGFAFRDLVENYIASVLLSLRQPFRPKDHVVIDGHEGLVTSMNTRTTVLTTFDGNIVRIPNAVVFKTTLTNYSTDARRRFSFSVGVGYDVDLRQAIVTGVDVLTTTEGVLTDPGPFGVITELGDSSIKLSLYGWVDQTKHDFGKVRSFAMQRVKSRFDELDIDMPEPIYKIKIDPAGALSGTLPEDSPADTAAQEPARKPAKPEIDAAPQTTAPDRTAMEMAESAAEEGSDLLDNTAKAE